MYKITEKQFEPRSNYGSATTTFFLCYHWDLNNDGGSSIKDAPHQPHLPNATTALTLLYSPLSAFLLWKHLQGHLSMRPLPDESAADGGQTLARRKQWGRIEKSRRGHLSGWERLFLCPDAAIGTGGEPCPGRKQQIDCCPDQNEDIIWSGDSRERNMERSFYSVFLFLAFGTGRFIAWCQIKRMSRVNCKWMFGTKSELLFWRSSHQIKTSNK